MLELGIETDSSRDRLIFLRTCTSAQARLKRSSARLRIGSLVCVKRSTIEAVEERRLPFHRPLMIVFVPVDGRSSDHIAAMQHDVFPLENPIWAGESDAIAELHHYESMAVLQIDFAEPSHTTARR